MTWHNPDKAPKILIGMENLPTPIVDHLREALGGDRPNYDHVYHVTEVLYCLRKAYYNRVSTGKKEFDLESLWNIYRGATFDALWSPLFDTNQENYKITRTNEQGRTVTRTGTSDFNWIDEESMEGVLYDLKMPKNLYFKKKNGAGKFYTEQVQTYLGMAHELGKHQNIHRCRVLMLADDLVIDEIPENDGMLDVVFERAFALDKALEEVDPDNLVGPEEKWECNSKYCPGDVKYRLKCIDFPNPLL